MRVIGLPHSFAITRIPTKLALNDVDGNAFARGDLRGRRSAGLGVALLVGTLAVLSDVNPRLIAALERQLASWRATLDSGAQRVGWKLGMGERERIGDGPVIGHLTSATCIETGGVYRTVDDQALHADAEVALELGTDGEIVGYGAALEIVDLGAPEDAAAIVATNVFHRAVAFGPIHPEMTAAKGQLIVNGQLRDSALTDGNYPPIVDRVSRLLAAVGERLLPGDRLITGSIVQVPVHPGDHVVADLGALRRAEVRITR